MVNRLLSYLLSAHKSIDYIVTKINTEQHAVTKLNSIKSPTPLAF